MLNVPHRPISLVANQITLASGASIVINDPTRLRNPLDAPMFIDSIVITPPLANGTPTPIADLLVKFKIGRHFLTNDFVPACTLDKVPNVSRSITGGGVTQVGDQGGFNFIWHFKKPLFVPRFGYMQAEFWNTGLTGQVAYENMVLTYRGRSLPQDFMPDAVHIPWNAAYMGPLKLLVNNATANSTEQSKATDLLNPFDVPFRIHRMQGTVAWNGAMDPVGTPDAPSLYALLRLTDSKGGIIIRDPTPLWHVFSPIDYSWPISATMEPKQNYIANYDLRYASTNAAGTVRTRVYTAVTGHRSYTLDEAMMQQLR